MLLEARDVSIAINLSKGRCKRTFIKTIIMLSS